MGCDIHCYSEINKDGKWEIVDKVKIDRNYSLFGILANVRNGWGCAGCDTGDGFMPIAEPRGLPENVSGKVKHESDEWGCDGHSHSYLTLAELIEYDWKRTTIRRGFVSLAEYKIFKENGRPNRWNGGISGQMVKIIENKEAEGLINAGILEMFEKIDRSLSWNLLPHYYTSVEWEAGYIESAKTFYNETMPALGLLGEPDTVRIVFWFDN
jgi:hypothetical protein